MSIEQVMYEYNPWWEAEYILPNVLVREQVMVELLPLISNKDVILLTGLRRVGKTVSMKLLVQHLVGHCQVNPMHIFYVSMDDYQLNKMSIIDVITEYRKCQRLSVNDFIYVFLDEITYVKDFQQQLKNLYDKGNIKIFCSSSSSSVLRDDSAYLTGRKRSIEIQPLSFREYLQFKNIILSKADANLYGSYFEDYMQVGGMPEYVLGQDREYLTNLIDDILMKDIVAYHSIRNEHAIRDFFILLMERVGKQISLNKIANILNISVDTVKRYLQMFEETFLIYLVPRHGKTNETLLSSKKVYAADLGMRNLITGFRDKGAVFENIVFMALKSYHPKYVYQDGHEIDFMIDGNILVEVKYHREIESPQLEIFENIKADSRHVISNYQQLEKFIENLQPSKYY